MVSTNGVPVSSGVPQGSVLGPILFLAYINDLSEQVKSRVRPFADGTAMYLAISSSTEGQVLQTDLECLEQWEKMWDIQFNPSKCQVLHITRKVKPLNTSTSYIMSSWRVLLQQTILGSPLLVTSHSLHTLITQQRMPIKPLYFLKETCGSIIRT